MIKIKLYRTKSTFRSCVVLAGWRLKFRRISRRQASQLPRWCDIPAAWTSKSTPFFHQIFGMETGLKAWEEMPLLAQAPYGGSLAAAFPGAGQELITHLGYPMITSQVGV